MFEFTHHNHYQFKYNEAPFTFRTSLNDTLSFGVGNCLRPPADWFTECIRSSQLIYKKIVPGQKLKLFYGGGLDSEIMVQAFLLANIPFTCIIIDIGNSITAPEVAHAVNFCKNYKIDYITIKVDPIDIINDNLHHRYYQQCQVKQLANMIILRAIELIDDSSNVYLLGGDITLSRAVDLDQFYASNDLKYKAKWYYQFKEDFNTGYTKYSLATGNNIISEFFSYTPEQLLSFLTDPIIDDLVNDRSTYKFSLASSKFKIYSRHFIFQARARSRSQKVITSLNDKIYLDLGIDNSGLDTDIVYRVPYTQILKQLNYD